MISKMSHLQATHKNQKLKKFSKSRLEQDRYDS